MYVIGDVGILEELDLKGYQYIGGPADNDKKIELSPGYALEHDHDVGPFRLPDCPWSFFLPPCPMWSSMHLEVVVVTHLVP